MTFKHVSKRRITAAATALTVAGVGVAWAFGGGTTMVSATGKARQKTAAQPAASAAAVVDGAGEAAGTTAASAAEHSAVQAQRVLRWALAGDWMSVVAAEVAAAGAQTGANASAPTGEAESDDGAGEVADITVRIPHRVSVSLPKVTNVRLPRVEGGSVQVGTLPSVEPGWKTTVDLGDPDPQVTLPNVNVGPVATVTMPGVSID